MKKLIMAAAALTIAVATAPGFVGSSEAAAAKAKRSEFCDMAKSQRNTPSWNEHYGCLKTAPGRQAYAAPARAPAATTGQATNSTYCGMAKSQRNTPSWNEYYHCLH